MNLQGEDFNQNYIANQTNDSNSSVVFIDYSFMYSFFPHRQNIQMTQISKKKKKDTALRKLLAGSQFLSCKFSAWSQSLLHSFGTLEEPAMESELRIKLKEDFFLS